MRHLQQMRYDALERQARTSKQIVSGGTPETTYYLYDMQGNRVRKVTESYVAARAQHERYRDALYLGESEIARDYDGDTILKEWKTDHISDDKGRFALLERFQNNTYLRYTHTDLLQSTRLETDDTGIVIGYEEYHPFGTTAYQATLNNLSSRAKRYRFAGKERDEESGLYYFGARYYAPWLGRFTSIDLKAGEYIHQTTYCYANNNPVSLIDFNGEGVGGDGDPEINITNQVVFIDNSSGRILGVEAKVEGTSPGIYSVNSSDYQALKNNSFKPLSEGQPYETSMNKSVKQVTVNTGEIEKVFKSLLEPVLDKKGFEVEKVAYLVFDSEKNEISAIALPTEGNTSQFSNHPFGKRGDYPVVKGERNKLILSSFHTHPSLTSSREKLLNSTTTYEMTEEFVAAGVSKQDFKISKDLNIPLFAIDISNFDSKRSSSLGQVKMYGVSKLSTSSKDFKTYNFSSFLSSPNRFVGLSLQLFR